jgi:hypothetical protein
MSEDIGQANCLEFQNHLSELMATGNDLRSQTHVKACELCIALVHDIYGIAADAEDGRFGKEEE